MFTKTIALVAAVAALAPTTMAAAMTDGHATAKNNCDKTMCIYTVPAGGGPIQNTFKVQPGGSHKFKYPADGGAGSQLRVSPNCDKSNFVYWELSQANDIIYYDVNIEGPKTNPFKQGLSVTGNDPSCPKISCAKGGATDCFNAPNGHPQNQIKACDASNSVTLHACKV